MLKKIIKNFLITLWTLINLSANISPAGDKAAGTSAVAVFAGGCFWCMEQPFDVLPGVITTVSGYTGGTVENPSYKEVSNGKTGHYEAVQITYDPALIGYEKLLDVFWKNIDPFDGEGQFCDQGEQYKAVIFYLDENQKQLAEISKTNIVKKFGENGGNQVITAIKPAGKFFPAEDYHQDYYINNPKRYKFYRFTCGRDRRLNQVWKN